MSKISIFSRFSELDTFKEFQRFVSAYIDQLTAQFNGNINFVSNVRASGPHDLTFSNGATYIGVTHSLRAIPTGIMPIYTGVTAAVLYAAPGASLAWTDSVIYLQASTGCTARIYVI